MILFTGQLVRYSNFKLPTCFLIGLTVYVDRLAPWQSDDEDSCSR